MRGGKEPQEEGLYLYLQSIHTDVQQKLIHHCEAIIKLNYKEINSSHRLTSRVGIGCSHERPPSVAVPLPSEVCL